MGSADSLGLRTEAKETPLQVKLDHLAERIAKIGASAAIFIFVVLMLKYIIVVVTNQGFESDCVLSEVRMITDSCCWPSSGLTTVFMFMLCGAPPKQSLDSSPSLSLPLPSLL